MTKKEESLVIVPSTHTTAVALENGIALDAFDILKTPFQTPSISWLNFEKQYARQDIITLTTLAYQMVRMIEWSIPFSKFTTAISEENDFSVHYSHERTYNTEKIQEVHPTFNYEKFDLLPTIQFSHVSEIQGTYKVHLSAVLSPLRTYVGKDREFDSGICEIKDNVDDLVDLLRKEKALSKAHKETNFGFSYKKNFHNLDVSTNIESIIAVKDNLQTYCSHINGIIKSIIECNGLTKT